MENQVVNPVIQSSPFISCYCIIEWWFSRVENIRTVIVPSYYLVQVITLNSGSLSQYLVPDFAFHTVGMKGQSNLTHSMDRF
mgnify:CR=1 FL=1